MNRERILIESCLVEDVPFFRRTRGTLLIRAVDAPRILNRLNSDGRRVVGLEGFELEGSFIRPRLDLIASFDPKSTANPTQVLANWDDDVWVNIVLSLDGDELFASQ